MKLSKSHLRKKIWFVKNKYQKTESKSLKKGIISKFKCLKKMSNRKRKQHIHMLIKRPKMSSILTPMVVYHLFDNYLDYKNKITRFIRK